MEIKTRKRPNATTEINNEKKQRKRASTRSKSEEQNTVAVSIATDSDTFSESSEMALNDGKMDQINATLLDKARLQLEENEKLRVENDQLHDELQQLKIAFAQRESDLQV